MLISIYDTRALFNQSKADGNIRFYCQPSGAFKRFPRVMLMFVLLTFVHFHNNSSTFSLLELQGGRDLNSLQLNPGIISNYGKVFAYALPH